MKSTAKYLVVFGAFALMIFWMITISKKKESTIVAGKLRLIALAFAGHVLENGEPPKRGDVDRDEKQVSWRKFVIVESQPDYRPFESNPIYCKNDNLSRFLAIDYPSSPWGKKGSELSKEPQMLVAAINSPSIPWESPGDIVIGKAADFSLDISEDAFLRLQQKYFLIGFTDGESKIMDKKEVLRCAANGGRIK